MATSIAITRPLQNVQPPSFFGLYAAGFVFASPSHHVAPDTLNPARSCFVPMARIRNVFEIIELYGHDENFEPHATTEFIPTAAPAGSRQKIDILAERIQRGMPLWHPEDSTDSSNAELVAEHV
jgi:hypothetical protein